MAEWLYEAGIGEARAALVENGTILEARIDRGDRVARGLWTRHKDEAVGRICQVHWIEERRGQARLVEEERVRWIESYRGAALRKDRLEQAPMIDAVAAAYRRIADVAKHAI